MDPLGQNDVNFSLSASCVHCGVASFIVSTSAVWFFYVLLFSSSSRLLLSHAQICFHCCSWFVCFYRQSCTLFWKWPFNEKKLHSCFSTLILWLCVCVTADNGAHQWNHQCLADVCPQKCLSLFPVVFPLWKWHHSYKNLAFVLPLLYSSQV